MARPQAKSGAMAKSTKTRIFTMPTPPLRPGPKEEKHSKTFTIKENMNNTIILLMPQPAQAERLLMGIINTPGIIEQIYNPLITRAKQLEEK